MTGAPGTRLQTAPPMPQERLRADASELPLSEALMPLVRLLRTCELFGTSSTPQVVEQSLAARECMSRARWEPLAAQELPSGVPGAGRGYRQGVLSLMWSSVQLVVAEGSFSGHSAQAPGPSCARPVPRWTSVCLVSQLKCWFFHAGKSAPLPVLNS